MSVTCRNFSHIAVLPMLFCSLLATSAGRLAAQTQAPAAPAQPVSTLTVRVTGLRNAEGKIRLTLFRDSNPVETREVEIDAGTLSAQTVFEKISPGVYAVYLFHDENMNGMMDTNDMGIPLEGYGMSNNPEKRPGKPGFDETNFPVNQPECAIEIKMIYW
ncbi:MAG: DUF2141 domain-containing protein [Terracidiphilus sp.]